MLKTLVCLALGGTLLLAGCGQAKDDKIVEGYLYFPVEASGAAGPDAIVAGLVTLTGNCWALDTQETDYPLFLAAPKGSVTIKTPNNTLALKTPSGLMIEDGDTLEDSGGYLSLQPSVSSELAALVKACPNVPGSQFEEDTWEIAAPSLRR